MEAYEHFVKVMLEGDGYVVATNVKFPVRMRTRKVVYEEYQEHGYEMDLVAARKDRLLLGSVKSFFGSQGVATSGFRVVHGAEHPDQRKYRIFNYPGLRNAIISAAAARYGYEVAEVRLALYVGRFRKGAEKPIRAHLGGITAGGGPVEVYGNDEVCDRVVRLLKTKTYVNDPVAMTLRALHAANLLKNRATARTAMAGR